MGGIGPRAARSDLSRALGGDVEAAALVARLLREAERSLRETMFELHPYALEEEVGLALAIRRVAEPLAERAGMALALEAEALTASEHHPRLFVIARELATNAARHSGGSALSVRLGPDVAGGGSRSQTTGSAIFAGGRRRHAAKGHVGLIAVAERVRAVAGVIEVASEPGAGTRGREAAG